MSDSLKRKTFKGAVWTGFERISNQLVGFVISIILARLLAPSDYGVIGMLSVFLSISQLFVDAGFSTALIQRKDRTDTDFSTVFWCNVGISIVCYVILFVASPWIAEFYRMPVLKNMMRILGLVLIINALYAVQVTRMTAAVNFKTQAKVSFSCCVLGGIVGIALAFCGFGAWTLVMQSVFASVYSLLVYWWISGWRPCFIFSVKSFKQLFSFGSKLLAANFIHLIYNNLATVIIGRKYSSAVLAYYTRADGLVRLPGGVFESTLGRVIFPVLASIQDDEARLRSAYNKYLRVITSVVVPVMLIMGAVAEPLILTLVGERWVECVPYVMLLSLGIVVDPIIIVNLNMLYTKGRSDIVLKWEFVKKGIAITLILISVPFGVIWLCVSRVIYGYIALFINVHISSPFIGMSFVQQVKEVWLIYACGFVSALIALATSKILVTYFCWDGVWWFYFARLCISASVGVLIYTAFAMLFRFDIVQEAKVVAGKLLVRKIVE